MPLVTSHTGITQLVRRIPTLPVFESDRVVEDWELMKVAQGLSNTTEAKRILYEFLNNERVDNLWDEYEGTSKGRTEGIYRCLLSWKERNIREALVGTIAKGLDKHGFRELAASLPT